MATDYPTKRETEIEVDKVIADEGTVIVLEGVDPNTGERWMFAADRRPALDIIAAMEADELPTVYVEDWQLLTKTGVNKAGE